MTTESENSTDEASYSFVLTDDENGFHIKFKRDAERLCGTIYQFAKALSDSLDGDTYSKPGDLLRSFAEMCDKIDELDKEKLNGNA